MSRAPTLREWLRAEPFTLAMSAGFFGFFAHAGMLEALEDEGILPARVTGASAGALVGGLWAAGRSAASVRAELLALTRGDFWDAGGARLGLLKGEKFRARLRAGLPVERFDGCRVPLSVSVFDLRARRTRVVDDGELSSAILASCAFPILFQPVWLDGRPMSDGGIADRHALAAVPRGDRVLHHLLISKSPWRRADSLGLAPPGRPNLACLTLRGLPRVGPFKLAVGRDALERARSATRSALDQPVPLAVR